MVPACRTPTLPVRRSPTLLRMTAVEKPPAEGRLADGSDGPVSLLRLTLQPLANPPDAPRAHAGAASFRPASLPTVIVKRRRLPSSSDAAPQATDDPDAEVKAPKVFRVAGSEPPPSAPRAEPEPEPALAVPPPKRRRRDPATAPVLLRHEVYELP